MYLTIKDDFEKLPNERTYKVKPEIEDSLKKQFAGREMIVFFDYSKLLNRFNEAGEKLNYPMIGHLVWYYDKENEPHPLTEEQYESNPVMSLFYKSKIFEHQKEFRLIIGKLLENDEIISIGDIGDIAHNLGKVELNKSLGLEFGFKDSDEEALNK